MTADTIAADPRPVSPGALRVDVIASDAAKVCGY
jgi:hypothetical protein